MTSGGAHVTGSGAHMAGCGSHVADSGAHVAGSGNPPQGRLPINVISSLPQKIHFLFPLAAKAKETWK